MRRYPNGAQSERDSRREARRRQLLDASIDAIATIGPGATMEQLARQGGVTKPILYRHFQDREGLIVALADRFSVNLMLELDAALVGLTEPRDLLDATVDAYLRFIAREPALYRFLLQNPVSSSGRPQMSPLVDAIARRVAVTMTDELQVAGLDAKAAMPWAYGMVGFVHHAGDWWLDDQTMSREELVRYLTRLLWNGIEAAAVAVTKADNT